MKNHVISLKNHKQFMIYAKILKIETQCEPQSKIFVKVIFVYVFLKCCFFVTKCNVHIHFTWIDELALNALMLHIRFNE